MIFGISGTKRTIRNTEVSVRRGEVRLYQKNTLTFSFNSKSRHIKKHNLKTYQKIP